MPTRAAYIIACGVLLLLVVQHAVLLTLLMGHVNTPASPVEIRQGETSEKFSATPRASEANNQRLRELALQNSRLTERISSLQSERDRLSRDMLSLIMKDVLLRIVSGGDSTQALASRVPMERLPQGQAPRAASAREWLTASADRGALDGSILEDLGLPEDIGITSLASELGDEHESALETLIGDRLDALLPGGAMGLGGAGQALRTGLQGSAQAMLKQIFSRQGTLAAGLGDGEWRALLRDGDDERTRQRRLMFTVLGLAALDSLTANGES